MTAIETKPSTLWRHSEFLKFWSGQTFSVFGSSITNLALPLTAVLILDATPSQMGLISAASTLPFLLVGLLVGVWIDRSRRRPIMLWADVGRALLVGSVPIAAALGILHIWLLYPIVFFSGVLQVFFDVSYQAFLPSLVGREHLVEGNSKMEISNSIAAIAGPGMAGYLVQLLTAPIAMAFDAVSFVVSALSLVWIHTPEEKPQSAHAKPQVWKEIKEGLGVVFGNRLLWSIAGSTGTNNLFSATWGAVIVLYLSRNLNVSPGLMGVMFAAGAPGALVGALAANRVSHWLGLGPTIVCSAALGGASSLLILLAHGTQPVIAGVMILTLFLLGFANVIYNVSQVSLRQAITPNRLLGRMNASMRFLVWGTLPLGGFLASALSARFGVEATILLGVIGQAFAFLWVLLSPVRKLREQPGPYVEEN